MSPAMSMLRPMGPQAIACRRATRSCTAFRPACVARPQARAPVAIPTSDNANPTVWLSAIVSAPFLLDVLPAAATGGEYGLLEGRTAALVHPAMMFFLLGSSLYAAYLGWQWRRTRELGDEIRALRASAPAATADGPAPANPVIAQKEQERKVLLAGGYKDKHHMWGSLLLASGVGMAIEGAANTFMRTGKLFPGPHLYYGAFIVALWALAASLVPAMQKGDNNARTAHIVLNSAQILLFLSQVPSGLEIVDKVFQFTVWP